MAFLYNSSSLHPNHYTSFSTLEHIQQCIEESCGELQIDYRYNPDQYSYECISYYKYRTLCVSINVFAFPSYHIIEIQDVYGDGFGYVKLVSEMRYKLQENGIIQTNYKPYVEKYEFHHCVQEVTTEYLLSLIHSVTSSDYTVQLDSIYLLANLSLESSIKQLMVQPYVLQPLLTFCIHDDTTIHRCALSIFVNLLHSDDSELVTLFLHENNMKCIVNNIINTSSTHQIKRECNIISTFLEK
jgi:hypothetical protein